MEQKYYETTIVFSLDSEENRQEFIDTYVSILEKDGAQIIYLQPPVHKKLAYPIKKKESALFLAIEFIALPTCIQKLERQYKRNECILRYLTIQLSKHAVKFKEEQRKNDKAKKESEDAQTEINHE